MISKMFASLLQVAVVASAMFVCAPADAKVWEATRQWDDRMEWEFGEFVKKVRMDIFTNEQSAYKNISTDCADAVYILRVIFAYEMGLPIAFHDRELTNENPSFDHVEAGIPRLRKFLVLVRRNTNTRTLVKDTYPVEINRKYLRAGSLFVHPASGNDVPLTYRAGHVYYITNISENGMIRYVSSTVPAMVRDLQPRIDITFAPFTKEGGYRAWKRPGAPTPGYSEEQFQLAGWRKNAYRDGTLWENWSRAIRSRMAMRQATAGEELGANAENIKGYLKERVHLVNRGWAMFQQKYGGDQCMNAQDYDDYSTPTRDVKIQTELQTMRDWAIRYLRSQGRAGSDSEIAGLFANYRYDVLPGVSVDLNHIWKTFQTEVVLAISEPEHSPEVRWGLRSQGRWVCPDRAKQYVGGERIEP